MCDIRACLEIGNINRLICFIHEKQTFIADGNMNRLISIGGPCVGGIVVAEMENNRMCDMRLSNRNIGLFVDFDVCSRQVSCKGLAFPICCDINSVNSISGTFGVINANQGTWISDDVGVLFKNVSMFVSKFGVINVTIVRGISSESRDWLVCRGNW